MKKIWRSGIFVIAGALSFSLILLGCERYAEVSKEMPELGEEMPEIQPAPVAPTLTPEQRAQIDELNAHIAELTAKIDELEMAQEPPKEEERVKQIEPIERIPIKPGKIKPIIESSGPDARARLSELKKFRDILKDKAIAVAGGQKESITCYEYAFVSDRGFLSDNAKNCHKDQWGTLVCDDVPYHEDIWGVPCGAETKELIKIYDNPENKQINSLSFQPNGTKILFGNLETRKVIKLEDMSETAMDVYGPIKSLDLQNPLAPPLIYNYVGTHGSYEVFSPSWSDDGLWITYAATPAMAQKQNPSIVMAWWDPSDTNFTPQIVTSPAVKSIEKVVWSHYKFDRTITFFYSVKETVSIPKAEYAELIDEDHIYVYFPEKNVTKILSTGFSEATGESGDVGTATVATPQIVPLIGKSPTVRPDGKYLAFVRRVDGKEQIWTCKLSSISSVPESFIDGKTLATCKSENQLTYDGNNTDPCWSSDNYIYFVSDRAGNNDIYRIKSGGTKEENLSSDSYPPKNDHSPACRNILKTKT